MINYYIDTMQESLKLEFAKYHTFGGTQPISNSFLILSSNLWEKSNLASMIITDTKI